MAEQYAHFNKQVRYLSNLGLDTCGLTELEISTGLICEFLYTYTRSPVPTRATKSLQFTAKSDNIIYIITKAI